MSAWRERGRRLREELGGNARLRWGLVVISAILAVQLFLVLSDWRTSLHDRYVERRQYLRKLRTLAGQEQWLSRASEASRLRKALEAEIPEVATLGLAQANAQAWVRDLASAHGQTVRVQARPPAAIEGEPGLYKIPVVLSGSLPPAAVINLIQRVEKHPSLAVIENAVLLNRENRTFELAVVSFARVKEAPADAGR